MHYFSACYLKEGGPMERLYEQMRRQLAYAPQNFRRYMYDRINWDNRMLGFHAT